MEKLILQTRTATGKKNKQLLRDGFTPAVVYNAKGESFNVQMPSSIAKKTIREATSTTIIEIELEGKDKKVIIKDLDLNPLTDVIRHISFFEVDENKEMTFLIPFDIIGVSPAVKNTLGILVTLLSSVEVRGKVGSLVDSFTVDISELERPGQSVSIGDIELPEGLTLVNADHAKSSIVTITQLQKQEVIEEEETEEGEEDAEGTEEGAEEGTEEKTEVSEE